MQNFQSMEDYTQSTETIKLSFQGNDLQKGVVIPSKEGIQTYNPTENIQPSNLWINSNTLNASSFLTHLLA